MPNPQTTFGLVDAHGNPTGQSLTFDCNPVDSTKEVFRFLVGVSGGSAGVDIYLNRADAIRFANTVDTNVSA
jgi:hypothetical protein